MNEFSGSIERLVAENVAASQAAAEQRAAEVRKRLEEAEKEDLLEQRRKKEHELALDGVMSAVTALNHDFLGYVAENGLELPIHQTVHPGTKKVVEKTSLFRKRQVTVPDAKYGEMRGVVVMQNRTKDVVFEDRSSGSGGWNGYCVSSETVRVECDHGRVTGLIADGIGRTLFYDGRWSYGNAEKIHNLRHATVEDFDAYGRILPELSPEEQPFVKTWARALASIAVELQEQ